MANTYDKPFRPKARAPRGFEDKTPDTVRAERRLIAAACAVYEASGFEPLETSAFEYADALGKFLPDAERPNEGVFALKDDDEQWMALRYDLTAPLARYVAQNYDGLAKPYRRYQAGPVWRNEKPGPGRFREFIQCDADSVGAPGPAADAEMVALAVKVMQAAGLKPGEYVVKVNDRRLLDGLLEDLGAPATQDGALQRLRVLRAVDKLDRLGPDGVTALLGPGRKDDSGDFTQGAGLDPAGIERVLGFTAAGGGDRASTLARVEAVVGSGPVALGGLEALRAIDEILAGFGIGADRAAFDPAVVRGLGYYTGPVFEAELLVATLNEAGEAVRVGSVGGGGRYDDLVARFKGQSVPATGFSFGVSRFAAALRLMGRLGAAEGGDLIVILPFEAAALAPGFALAETLRAQGWRAEVYLGGSGPKAQMKYADKRGARFAVMIGGDELAAGTATVKDLVLGAKLAQGIDNREAWTEARPAQETIAREALAGWLATAKDAW